MRRVFSSWCWGIKLYGRETSMDWLSWDETPTNLCCSSSSPWKISGVTHQLMWFWKYSIFSILSLSSMVNILWEGMSITIIWLAHLTVVLTPIRNEHDRRKWLTATSQQWSCQGKLEFDFTALKSFCASGEARPTAVERNVVLLLPLTTVSGLSRSPSTP